MIVTKKQLMAILTLSVTVLFWGCGSSGGGGDDPAPPPRVIAFTGSGGCIACHEDYDFSADIVAGYLESKHLVHSTEITAASGTACLECHDPVGEGPMLEAFVPASAVPEAGLAAVGCENCHGPGGDHYGVGPIPVLHPGVDACGKCHKDLPAGPAAHGTGESLVGKYFTSGHASSILTPVALCARCHTDEGFRLYVDHTRGLAADQLTAAMAGEPLLSTLSTIQCRTCHDSHSGELRAAAAGEIADGAQVPPFSQGFNLCTGCHQIFLTATYNSATQAYAYVVDDNRVPYHGTAGNPAQDSLGLVIWDTHFPSPTHAIAGYGINAADEAACTRCHDAHAAGRP